MIAFVFGVMARLDLRGVDAFRPRVAVDEHGRRAGDPDGFGGSEERVGVCDDLVAGPDAHRHQRQPDRVRAVAGSDGVRRSVESGQFLLELLEHRSLHVLAAFEHPPDVGVDVRLNVVVLPNVTVKADLRDHLRHRFSPASKTEQRFGAFYCRGRAAARGDAPPEASVPVRPDELNVTRGQARVRPPRQEPGSGGLEIVMSLRGDTINGGCLGASRDRTHVGPDVADRGPVEAFHPITFRRVAEVIGCLTDCGVLVEAAW